MKPDALDQLTDELFAAARNERPDPKLLERVLAQANAAGLGSTVDVSRLLRVVGAPAAEPELARPRSEQRRRATLRRLLLAAALVGVAAGAALLNRRLLDDGEVPPVISAERPPSSAAIERSETVAPEAQERAVSSLPAPPAPSTRPRRPSSVADPRADRPRPGPPDTAARFTTELHLLQQAQSALRAGAASEALTFLDRYSSELPGASLTVEATVLRIQTLIALGREPEALTLAQRFVQEHPDDPLVDRVRSFLRNTPAASGTQGRRPRASP